MQDSSESFSFFTTMASLTDKGSFVELTASKCFKLDWSGLVAVFNGNSLDSILFVSSFFFTGIGTGIGTGMGMGMK